MRRYKDQLLQKTYDACRALGADKTSEFWLNGQPRKGGSNARQAYWAGRTGRPNTLWPRGSQSAAAWAAGKDDQD